MRRAFAAVTLLILAAPLANAQAQLPDPGILPDNPFYGLKRFFEELGTTITFGEDARAIRALDLAELRLAETRAVSEMGRPEFVEDLAADYEKEIENSNRAVYSISDPERREAVSEWVAKKTSSYLDVLDSVEDTAPEQARPAIAAAKERYVKGNMEALRILATEDPEKAAEIAMQVAQGRAEKSRAAAERGDDSKAVEAAKECMEYERFGDEISEIAQKVGKDPSKVRELVAKSTSLSTSVLEEVKEKVREDARSSIVETMGESRKVTGGTRGDQERGSNSEHDSIDQNSAPPTFYQTK